MTTLLLGASGMLGRALARELPTARALTHRDLDLTDAAAIAREVVPGVTTVVNAAAYTRVDDAETDPHHLAVNADAVGTLAARCKTVGAKLVHVSTDYVFDGQATRPYREEDPVNPVNAYGRGKLEGEIRAAESGAAILIVRTSWLCGPGRPNFIEAILGQVEAGKHELKVVVDQVGRPTFTRDLAHAIRVLLEKGAYGIVHFANAGETTWFDFARVLVGIAGRPDVIVRPCPTSDYPRPARRPHYSVLDTALYERVAFEKPRPWREALTEYVAERTAALPRAAVAEPPGTSPPRS